VSPNLGCRKIPFWPANSFSKNENDPLPTTSPDYVPIFSRVEDPSSSRTQERLISDFVRSPDTHVKPARFHSSAHHPGA